MLTQMYCHRSLCVFVISGYVKDITGSYDSMLVATGCVILACALVLSIAYALRVLHRKKDESKTTLEISMISATKDDVTTHM